MLLEFFSCNISLLFIVLALVLLLSMHVSAFNTSVAVLPLALLYEHGNCHAHLLFFPLRLIHIFLGLSDECVNEHVNVKELIAIKKLTALKFPKILCFTMLL